MNKEGFHMASRFFILGLINTDLVINTPYVPESFFAC